jgi:hypothetical protein
LRRRRIIVRLSAHFATLIGLKISIPSKSFSLSVTTRQSFAMAMAATIVSRLLRGRPFIFPSAISRAQTSLLVERQNAPGKKRLWTFRPFKPRLQLIALLARRLLENAAPNFSDG